MCVQTMRFRIPASITFSQYPRQNKYVWLKQNKTSTYDVTEKRLVLRISTGQFGKKASKLDKKNRQISVTFSKDKNLWTLTLRRVRQSNVIISSLVKNPSHILLQVVLNKLAPQKLLQELAPENKYGSKTLSVKVGMELADWKDINLNPEDFLYHTELHAKSLLKYALNKNFTADYIPKGRECDLQLISSSGKKFAIAIASHIAKSKSRSKQHRVQKALIDIAKMLSIIYFEKDITPVIISRPIEFKGSWNFTGNNYLKFYQEKFGFKFISTDFKNGWEQVVCEQLGKM